MSQLAVMELCALLLGAARPAAAQSAAAMVAAQSEIVFTSRQMGVPVEGRFRRFEAHITLDPKVQIRFRLVLTGIPTL
jgi:polyisoprenoid-binding protein YceI